MHAVLALPTLVPDGGDAHSRTGAVETKLPKLISRDKKPDGNRDRTKLADRVQSTNKQHVVIIIKVAN